MIYVNRALFFSSVFCFNLSSYLSPVTQPGALTEDASKNKVLSLDESVSRDQAEPVHHGKLYSMNVIQFVTVDNKSIHAITCFINA